jgi:anti-anti-sigma regulatory factor
LSGDFDANTAPQFEQVAGEEIGNGAKDFIIDLDNVGFMSSSGIRSLNKLYKILHESDSEQTRKAVSKGVRDGTYQSQHLKLLNPSKDVHDVLKMVGLDMVLGIFDNEQEAIGAF